MHISLLWIAVLAVAVTLLRVLIARRKLKAKSDILVMRLNGVIQFSEAPGSGFQKTMQMLDEAEARKPKALIVLINSPGGGVGATDQIYRRLMELRGKGTKVVAVMEDVTASGGVYVAMASDWIIAAPTTITGSIGVIMQYFEYGKVLDFFNIVPHIIKSGEHKDILSPFREQTPADLKILQDLIDETYLEFCAIIGSSRERAGLTMSKLFTIADGRVFSGRKALELKLVDDVGSLREAIQKAGELAGLPPDKQKHEVLRAKKVPFILKFQSLAPGARLENKLLSHVPDASLMNVPLLLWKP